MIRVFSDYTGDFSDSCDICVIGSGPGGAVVACELAEKGYSVVLFEEGGHYTVDDWDGKPVWGLMNLYRERWYYWTLSNTFISVTLGKCIGGTSTINSATCFRTPDAVLEKWRKYLGLDNITPETLTSYFEKVEKAINVTELSWDVLGKNAEIVKRGCDRLGLNCKAAEAQCTELQGVWSLSVRMPGRGKAKHGPNLCPYG